MLILALVLTPLVASAQCAVYTNPIIADGADPGLVQENGMTYIFVTSQMNTVMVKSPNGATDWSEPKIVYKGNNNQQGWAPSLRKTGDTWHLYTAGAYCEGNSLEGPFEYKKRALGFDPYYYHDVEGSGKHWFVWGGSHTGNCVAEMETASTLKPDTGLYFLPPTGWGGTWEGLWVERVNGKYVMMISADSANSPNYRLHYAVADSLEGPYVFMSDVRDAAFLRRSDYEHIYGPGHHAMMRDKNGTWWVYYQHHNDGGGHWNRSIAIDPLWFDASGHPQMRPTRGIGRPGPGSAPGKIWPALPSGAVIEAEAYHGSRCCNLMDGNGGTVVGDFKQSGFIAFRNVEFAQGFAGLSVTVANGNESPATLEFRLGSAKGKLLAALIVPPTGNWDIYRTETVRLRDIPTGLQDVLLVVTGRDPSAEALRIDRFRLVATAEREPVDVPSVKPVEKTVAAGKTLEVNLLDGTSGLKLVSVNGARSEKAKQENLRFTPDGALTYQPPENYWGTDRVFYTVENADGALSRGTLTLLVEPEKTARFHNGTAVLEAEDFAGGFDYKDELAWETASTLGGFSGSGYVQTPNNGTKQFIAERAGTPRSAQLDYAVRVTDPGVYHVWARVFAPDSESAQASISLCTSSDTQVRPDINQAWLIEPKTTGQWEWVEVDNPLSVPAGLQRLALRRGQDGLAVDRIVMTRSENFNPEEIGFREKEQGMESGNFYAFSYFMDNGESGLHLALSTDGLHWQTVNGGKGLFKAEVAGENLMRDPFVMPDPKGKGYHALWTTGWRGRSIGYAFSEDLIHWKNISAIPVMEHIDGALNTWAPEMCYDETSGRFWIYYATRIPDRYDGHRMWCVTTTDFKTFTPAELFFDPGYSVIDAHLIRDNGRFVMIFKDERKGHKHLKLAFADSPAGPWSEPTEPISAELTEGPASLKLGDGFLILYDNYGAHHYGGFRTKDFQTLEPIDDQLELPGRVRHGTLFSIPAALFSRLQTLKGD